MSTNNDGRPHAWMDDEILDWQIDQLSTPGGRWAQVDGLPQALTCIFGGGLVVLGLLASTIWAAVGDPSTSQVLLLVAVPAALALLLASVLVLPGYLSQSRTYRELLAEQATRGRG